MPSMTWVGGSVFTLYRGQMTSVRFEQTGSDRCPAASCPALRHQLLQRCRIPGRPRVDGPCDQRVLLRDRALRGRGLFKLRGDRPRPGGECHRLSGRAPDFWRGLYLSRARCWIHRELGLLQHRHRYDNGDRSPRDAVEPDRRIVGNTVQRLEDNAADEIQRDRAVDGAAFHVTRSARSAKHQQLAEPPLTAGRDLRIARGR